MPLSRMRVSPIEMKGCQQMRRRPAVAAVAAASALALALAGCGSSGSNSGGGSTSSAAFNAGSEKVFNPSDKKGGTLRFANSDQPDSVDGADTYYGYMWDFIRVYGRALTMFDTKPGEPGTKLVGDLAEDLGKPSADAKTWTYK